MKFRTPYNFKSDNSDIEFVDKTIQSVTEPDMNLTVRELLKRFAHGTLPNVGQPDDGIDEVTFEDYLHFKDLDYDLSDATRDRMMLLERDHAIQQVIDRKTKARQKELDQEIEDAKKWREFKKQQEAEELKKTQRES